MRAEPGVPDACRSAGYRLGFSVTHGTRNVPSILADAGRDVILDDLESRRQPESSL